MGRRRIHDLFDLPLDKALRELRKRHMEAYERSQHRSYQSKLGEMLARDEYDLKLAAKTGIKPGAARKPASKAKGGFPKGKAHTGYKGRNAKLAVIGFRLTDYELDEIEAAIAKTDRVAGKLGATVGYVRSDLVRAAVLDFARWINEPGEKHMRRAIDLLEDQFK